MTLKEFIEENVVSRIVNQLPTGIFCRHHYEIMNVTKVHYHDEFGEYNSYYVIFQLCTECGKIKRKKMRF